MTSRLLRSLLIACALVAAPLAIASPPSTITYQGTLGSASGEPIDDTLQITFSLYDAASGGAALWDETSTVVVADGRFAVALGSVTPLPDELFANPLFLAIQVAGDVQMTPRLALSSTPTALRARALLRNTVHVASDGTPQVNAMVLRSAVANAALAASADNRMVVAIDAGEFDLGTSVLLVPPFVELVGAGPLATLLRATVAISAVELGPDSGLRSLGVRNDGSGGDFATPTSAVLISDLAERVLVESVSANSTPPVGIQGSDVRVALMMRRAANVRIADSDFVAMRSDSLYGIRASGVAGEEPAGGTIVMHDVRVDVSAATSNARGLDFFGRMELSIEGMRIDMSSGGISPANTLALRTQLETSLIARGIVATLDYADASPTQARGINFSRPPGLDVSGFHVRLLTGSCPAGGFRNAVVFQGDELAGYLPQSQPRLSDGVVEVDATDCFSGGIYSSGAKPLIDNVRVTATINGSDASAQAVAYTQRTVDSLCDGGGLQAGEAVIRNSSMKGISTGSGQGNGIDVCVDGLSLEHSTVFGSNRGFIAQGNSAASYAFAISHSRLATDLWEPLATFSDASATVVHTRIDSPPGFDIRATVDSESGQRSTIACAFVSTPTSIANGPACPCTAGIDCPVTP